MFTQNMYVNLNGGFTHIPKNDRNNSLTGKLIHNCGSSTSWTTVQQKEGYLLNVKHIKLSTRNQMQKAMYCVIQFAGYPGEGKYVSAEDTEVAAIARNWILTAKGHIFFFKVQGILYLNFDSGHTIVSICENS